MGAWSSIISKGSFHMNTNTILARVRGEMLSFYESPSKKNELFFLILFGCYEAFNFFLKIKWNDNIDVDFLRIAFVEVIMLGAPVYLVYAIGDWKKLVDRYLWVLFLIGVALMGIAGYFSTKLSTNAFGVVFDIYFCLTVIGKDYKKILRNTMWIAVATLVLCYIGMLAGFTIDVIKPDNNPEPGHSLGTVYPNTWGYIGFLILLIVWYLYLRRKSIKQIIITFVIFWGASAFMYFYICCHTIAILTLPFPLFAVFVDWLEKKADERAAQKMKSLALEAEQKRKDAQTRRQIQKTENKKRVPQAKQQEVIQASAAETAVVISDKTMKRNYLSSVIQWIVTAIPYISLVFVIYVSNHYAWVHKHFYGRHATQNLALRFMQGGMYFAVYGIPLVGNPYDSRNIGYVDVNGEFFQVGILDSSFASYIIMRGLLWILLCMLWLSIANWKAMKKRDYAIPLIGLFILGYAMMERPGLELWYNFILLYPLAKVMNKAGTKIFKEVKPTLYKNRTKNRKR